MANGDVFAADDVDSFLKDTGVDGVMSARGILANPALFAGYKQVPLDCVKEYLDLALQYGGRFSVHHHHLMFMLQRYLPRAERLHFSSLNTMAAVVDFFSARGW